MLYASNKALSNSMLDYLYETKPKFAAFCDKQARSEACHGLNLKAFLIAPISRLCKYPLLFRDLRENTPAGHP